jgi:hypothetical protein
LRLCLERIVGPYRERAVEFTMPPIGNAADLAGAMAAVADATARGAVTPREAMQLGQARLVGEVQPAGEIPEQTRCRSSGRRSTLCKL